MRPGIPASRVKRTLKFVTPKLDRKIPGRSTSDVPYCTVVCCAAGYRYCISSIYLFIYILEPADSSGLGTGIPFLVGYLVSRESSLSGIPGLSGSCERHPTIGKINK